MSDDQTPEEQAAKAAFQRVQALRLRALKAGGKLQEALRSDDVERQAAAADDVLVVTEALMRAVLDASHMGDTSHLGFTPAEATTMLLWQRDRARVLFPTVIDHMLRRAFAEGDDPHTRELREDARGFLVDLRLVTEHELETFPPASVEAIVRKRYRTSDEAH